MHRIIEFLKESRIELKKVTWPTRSDALRYTVVVIIISGAVALFLGGLDYLFQYLLTNFVL